MTSFVATNSVLRNLLLAILAASLCVVVGCERSPEDLEDWRNARNGMTQLAQWAADESEPTDVRIRAVQILIEEDEADRVPRTLNEIDDEDKRQTLADGAMPTIEEMWEQQDFPELTEEMRQEGAQIPVEDFQAVRAIDAIYRLYPFFGEQSRQTSQDILRDWIGEDQRLRNELAQTRIPFLIQYAGDDAVMLIENWIMETPEPYELARTLRNNVPEDDVVTVDELFAQRAKEAHPDLDEQMGLAVVHADTEGMLPYIDKVIEDKTDLLGDVLQTLANIGGAGHDKLLELAEHQTGALRWSAISRLLEEKGVEALPEIAAALPADEAAYDVGDRSLDNFSRAVCRDAQRAAESEDLEAVDEVLTSLMDEDHWPGQLLALQCAQIFEAQQLRDDIQQLQDNSTTIPHLEAGDTVGELATIADAVLEQMDDDGDDGNDE